MTAVNHAGKRLVTIAGSAIQKLQRAAGHLRPIGDQASVFADFMARGFEPAIVYDIGAAGGTWTAAVDDFACDIAGFIRRPLDGAVGLMDVYFSRSLRGPENEWHARP